MTNPITPNPITAALDGLDGLRVLTDPTDAISAVLAGESVLMLHPPRLSFTTQANATATWEAHLVSGATTSRTAAWTDLGTRLTAIHQQLPLTEATPYDWDPSTGTDTPLPAYQLTFTTDHDL